jgi:hypothetical protein
MSNFGLYLFIIIFHTTYAVNCPLNGLSSMNNDNKCYYFFSAEQDFIKAERTCEEQGGHLVSICNAFVNNFLKGNVLKDQSTGKKTL